MVTTRESHLLISIPELLLVGYILLCCHCVFLIAALQRSYKQFGTDSAFQFPTSCLSGSARLWSTSTSKRQCRQSVSRRLTTNINGCAVPGWSALKQGGIVKEWPLHSDTLWWSEFMVSASAFEQPPNTEHPCRRGQSTGRWPWSNISLLLMHTKKWQSDLAAPDCMRIPACAQWKHLQTAIILCLGFINMAFILWKAVMETQLIAGDTTAIHL